MGPIVDATQLKSIDSYVQQAKADGAEVYQACACMPSEGNFYPPTLITKVQPVSTCVQEEVRAETKVLFILVQWGLTITNTMGPDGIQYTDSEVLGILKLVGGHYGSPICL